MTISCLFRAQQSSERKKETSERKKAAGKKCPAKGKKLSGNVRKRASSRAPPQRLLRSERKPALTCAPA